MWRRLVQGAVGTGSSCCFQIQTHTPAMELLSKSSHATSVAVRPTAGGVTGLPGQHAPQWDGRE